MVNPKDLAGRAEEEEEEEEEGLSRAGGELLAGRGLDKSKPETAPHTLLRDVSCIPYQMIYSKVA